MSYVTQDRHGACTIKYATIKSKEVVGTGKTWWPDYGPSLRDHSFLEKFAPHHHIFEKVVKPHTVGKTPNPPRLEREPAQFRHPAPGREAMLLKDQPTHERRLAAKEVTDRQSAIRMMEVRQKKIDSWLEDAPIRMAATGSSKAKALRGSQSAPALPSKPSEASAQHSREVYEKLGFLVGRSKAATTGGFSGVTNATRRHNPLSLNALMFSGNVVDSSRASRSLSRTSLPKKPSGQWKVFPESGFVFDPKTSLPVPRGGWNSQPQTSWPEVPPTGNREWAAPVTFDARPKATGLEALPEWPKSPSAAERSVVAGTAGSTVRKLPYGDREPGQERRGMGADALRSTGSFGNTAVAE